MESIARELVKRIRTEKIVYTHAGVDYPVVGVNLNGPADKTGLYILRDGEVMHLPMSKWKVYTWFADPVTKWEPKHFKHYIFFGNGTASDPEVLEAHRQLDEAFEVQGGLQQPHMSTDEPAGQEELDYNAAQVLERDNLVRSLVTALGATHLLK